MKIRRSTLDYVFDTVNVSIMVFLVIVTAYPMYYVISASLSSNIELVANPGFLPWPRGFTIGAYRFAFQHPLLLGAYRNTLFVLGVSLPIQMALTLLCGYFLACRGVMFKKWILAVIMFTMFFNAGMIPNFLNIRDLGLFNSLWALILPASLSVFNSIICKTAIENVPDSLAESAYIDGAQDFTIIFRIIVPLIMPTLAVLTLFYGVQTWNAWFHALIYIQDNAKLPVQNILRAVLIENNTMLNAAAGENDRFDQFAETIKYAAIVITTVPVMMIYPFLQKFFVKGVLIGAVKG
jgi:putative aldouronate transport system permease protein